MGMKKVLYRETSKVCLVCRKLICKLELKAIRAIFLCNFHKQTLACNNIFAILLGLFFFGLGINDAVPVTHF